VTERRGDERYLWLVAPLAVVLVGLLLVFFVFFHYIQVDGDSMLPTLRPDDHLLLTKAYRTPHRGDIVVFTLIENERPTDVIKRVVAIPGDTVLTRGDHAWVNGKPEQLGSAILAGDSQRVVGPLKVKADTVFVLGDNRAISLDSRYIGPVPLRDVVGRALAVFTPVTRLRMLPPGK
jgi:signal peptidase I